MGVVCLFVCDKNLRSGFKNYHDNHEYYHDNIRIIRKNCEYNEEYFHSVARAASAESTMS